MSYIKKSGGTVAIQIDTDYLARQLHKYSLAALVNSFGEDGGEIDCSFGFDYMPNGQDLFTLTATVIEPVGSSSAQTTRCPRTTPIRPASSSCFGGMMRVTGSSVTRTTRSTRTRSPRRTTRRSPRSSSACADRMSARVRRFTAPHPLIPCRLPIGSFYFLRHKPGIIYTIRT